MRVRDTYQIEVRPADPPAQRPWSGRGGDLSAVRRVLLDVVLLDSDLDDAPSLADMARRARALLDRLPEDP